MEKKEVINSIIDLFDLVERRTRENYALKDELARYKRNTLITPTEAIAPNIELGNINNMLIEYAKKKIFHDIFEQYTWNRCECRKGDDGTYYFTNFDRWVKSKTYDFNIPDFMSKQQLLHVFEAELQELYEKENAEALNKKMQEEKEEIENE